MAADERFLSRSFDSQGSFPLILSADDYAVVMHALVVAGSAIEEKKGTDAAAPYDGLHDRLMDWNHCDIQPDGYE